MQNNPNNLSSLTKRQSSLRHQNTTNVASLVPSVPSMPVMPVVPPQTLYMDLSVVRSEKYLRTLFKECNSVKRVILKMKNKPEYGNLIQEYIKSNLSITEIYIEDANLFNSFYTVLSEVSERLTILFLKKVNIGGKEDERPIVAQQKLLKFPSQSKLQSITMMNCSIKSQHFATILHNLQQLQLLKSLNLSSNQLRITGDLICQALISLTALEKVELQYNQIYGSLDLVRLLTQSQRLCHINLAQNYIANIISISNQNLLTCIVQVGKPFIIQIEDNPLDTKSIEAWKEVISILQPAEQGAKIPQLPKINLQSIFDETGEVISCDPIHRLALYMLRDQQDRDMAPIFNNTQEGLEHILSL